MFALGLCQSFKFILDSSERKELIKAPVTTNEPLARINIKLGDRVLKTVPLYAVADVAEKKSKLSDIYKTFKQIIE